MGRRMKKINSIWYGSKILAAGGSFAVAIPLILYLLYVSITKIDIVLILIKVSISVGILILGLFCLMLAIESKQDKNIDLQYNKVKCQKIQISDNLYECQYCGNQEVKKEDLFCKVCNIKFR
jgi:hypothetical protein